MEPNNIPLTVLGAGLLWVFGWFGLMPRSALSDNAFRQFSADHHTSAATAGLVWMVLSWLDGRPSTLGIATEWWSGWRRKPLPASSPHWLHGVGAVAGAAFLLHDALPRPPQARRVPGCVACHGIASTWA